MNSTERLVPTEIKLHQESRLLGITYADGKRFDLPYVFSRVYLPAAEVPALGSGKQVLRPGRVRSAR